MRIVGLYSGQTNAGTNVCLCELTSPLPFCGLTTFDQRAGWLLLMEMGVGGFFIGFKTANSKQQQQQHRNNGQKATAKKKKKTTHRQHIPEYPASEEELEIEIDRERQNKFVCERREDRIR